MSFTKNKAISVSGQKTFVGVNWEGLKRCAFFVIVVASKLVVKMNYVAGVRNRCS